VTRAGDPYRLSGPISRLAQAHQGSILFFRQPELPPGSYMLEAALYDGLASTAGARFMPFTVFAPSSRGLLVSSLVLIDRAEPAGGLSPEDTNPLITHDVLVYPPLGDPYRKSTDSVISLFVRVRVSKGMAVPAATLFLLRNAQPAARLSLRLPAPDANGVIDQVAQLALEPLPIGDFTLRLVVNGDGDEVVRELPVKVVE
jgi:hypothetical protein